MKAPERDPEFEGLLDHIRRTRGFDFSGYKRVSLIRRVQKRMQAVGLSDFADYQDYLEVHPEEFPPLFNTILINVTSFFRDQPAWDCLKREVLPRIIDSKGAHGPIRVWSAGCASGEEAYTLAILLCEAVGPEQFRQRVKIYATDADEEALAQARAASFEEKALQELPADLRTTYFEPIGGRSVFRGDLRRSVIFGRHDLVQDAPISRLDLLVCRNTLMYFNSETQGKILARFHFALGEGGYLFLGKAEMLLTFSSLFSPVDLKHRVFVRQPKDALRERLMVFAQGNEEAGNHVVRQVRLRETAFDACPVAQAVVDLNGKLVMANERLRSLFGVSNRDMGKPFQDVEFSYRPVELRSRLEQAYSERRVVTVPGVERRLPDASVQVLDVQVAPLLEDGGVLVGATIIFADVTASRRLQEDLKRSAEELETSNQELESAHEELETTNEELQSSNEELETTNEELQSSNEELETMNEELQSANEELQTVNEQLRQRTDELNQSNAFLRSILDSVQVGVVVVDERFNVLAWNRRAEELWGLRADEVAGKPLLNLDIGLPTGELLGSLRSALAGHVPDSEVVLKAVNRRGRKILCRVAVSTLRGEEELSQGAILMMEEDSRGGAHGRE